MKKSLSMLFCISTVLLLTPSANADEEEVRSMTPFYSDNEEEVPSMTPWAAITLDYLATSKGGYGLTVTANHYDDHFPNWGYYGGYAKLDGYEFGDERDIGYEYDRSMFRLGVSYSFTNDFSLYVGGAYASDKGTAKDRVVNPCVDCTSEQPQETNQNQWGGEVGLRYAYKNLLVGIGFDTVNQASMFSIGYRGN